MSVTTGTPVYTDYSWDGTPLRVYLSGSVVNNSYDWAVTELQVTVTGGTSATVGRTVLPPGSTTWWEVNVPAGYATYGGAGTWRWIRASCLNAPRRR
jgi:hypothetical protein